MLHVPLRVRWTPASRATRHRDPNLRRDDSGEDRVGRTAPPLTIFGSRYPSRDLLFPIPAVIDICLQSPHAP
jgi:hypothetical protein